MRIITFISASKPDEVQALTQDEWNKDQASDISILADYDEYVWQDQPSKEAAISRHHKAHGLWADDMEEGRLQKEFY